jgi:hypothetical protein
MKRIRVLICGVAVASSALAGLAPMAYADECNPSTVAQPGACEVKHDLSCVPPIGSPNDPSDCLIDL